MDFLLYNKSNVTNYHTVSLVYSETFMEYNL